MATAVKAKWFLVTSSIVWVLLSVITFVGVVTGYISSSAIDDYKVNTMWEERAAQTKEDRLKDEAIAQLKTDVAVIKTDVSYIREFMQKKSNQ